MAKYSHDAPAGIRNAPKASDIEADKKRKQPIT